MRKLRQVTEAKVISEFLKNEFYHEEFHRDRKQFERLVLDADLSDEQENRVRRALLFRRRGHMWRELPSDTQWWEVELEPADLVQLKVFPRAHWRKLAAGSFILTDIVERIRSGGFSGRIREFISRLETLSERLRNDSDGSYVVLIGLGEKHPITIIEGNHRMTAAMMGAPNLLHSRFRVFFGASDRMNEVCWYHSSLANLARYGWHRLKHLLSDRETNLTEVRSPATPIAAANYVKAVAGTKVMPESK